MNDKTGLKDGLIRKMREEYQQFLKEEVIFHRIMDQDLLPVG